VDQDKWKKPIDDLCSWWNYRILLLLATACTGSMLMLHDTLFPVSRITTVFKVPACGRHASVILFSLLPPFPSPRHPCIPVPITKDDTIAFCLWHNPLSKIWQKRTDWVVLLRMRTTTTLSQCLQVTFNHVSPDLISWRSLSILRLLQCWRVKVTRVEFIISYISYLSDFNFNCRT
jgi:hypothetical protein